MSNGHNPEFHAFMGSTGSGKSTRLKKQLSEKPRPRTLIWSPKEAEDCYISFYPRSKIARSPSEVAEILQDSGQGGFHVVYVPSDDMNEAKDKKAFDLVCKMALAVGDCTVIVDELHTVTTATHAVAGWKLLNNMGRAKRIDVLGLSPRPADIDKAFMGNLSSLSVARLSHYADQVAMARALRVPVDLVASLYNFDFVRRDMITGALFEYRTGDERKPAKKPAAATRRSRPKAKK